MALNSPYATPAQFNAHTRQGTSYDQDVVQRCLAAMSRYFDRKVLNGESFNLAPTATARILELTEAHQDLSGYPPTVIDIPPVGALDDFAVVLDTGGDGAFAEDPVPSTSYELRPSGALTLSEPAPFTEIAVTTWGTLGAWPAPGRMQLTARWGFPEVPEGVRWATIEFTRMALGEGIFATGAISEIDRVVSASPQARGILKDLIMSYHPTGGYDFA